MGEYGVTATRLRRLMELRGREGKAEIDRLGGIDKLLRDLKTDRKSGLSGLETELSRRRDVFGHNIIPPKPPKTFFQLAWEALHDTTLIILCVAGTLSLILGVTVEKDKSVGWIEGFAILVAVVCVVLVTAFNDYAKEKQFRGLQRQIEQEMRFSVLRDGEVRRIATNELVVGDIALFKFGDKLPADGIILQATDLRIDESSLTGESDQVVKTVEKNPMALSGTQVMEGTGQMVITAVGLNSQSGVIFQLLTGVRAPHLIGIDDPTSEEPSAGPSVAGDIELKGRQSPSAPSSPEDEADDDENRQSVLQSKLTKMAIRIGYFGAIAAIASLVVLVFRFVIEEFAVDGRAWDSSEDFSELLHFFIIAITVLVVAVPEGLPLAVTLSLAYSVRKMTRDHNLVRHLHACETMGNATVICSDKTGTLTTNRMTVVNSYIAGQHFQDEIFEENIGTEIADLLADAISINSLYSSRILPPDIPGGLPKQIGNATECALLSFVENDLKRAYEEIRNRHPISSFVKVFTFNAVRKSMSTVIRLPSGGYRLFCKGASEIVLGKCSKIVGLQGEKDLPDDERAAIITRVVEGMASHGLRTIGLAYRDFAVDELGPVKEGAASDDSDIEELFANESQVVANMTCLGIVGIEDPVRPEVPNAIRQCHRAGIVVRMVTGDNQNTARAIAIKCGILRRREGHIVLTGQQFNDAIRNKNGTVNQQLFDKVWPQMRVLARSTPRDKHTLVKGIIESKLNKNREVVAVTGDGTNDGPALKRADVGFAMGIAGTDVAKEASDIILTDDNFRSIVKAVMWGRNIYDSIAKFLQFQLTVNLVAVLVAFISACTIKETPLTAVQLLWVNLIMDTMASLALATEPPTPELLTRKPYGRKKPLISRSMFRFIVGHGIYQLIVTFVLVFAGEEAFDVDSGRGKKLRDDPTQHYTIVFNAFVLMQVFNEINARKIRGERNVFKGIFDNPIFIAIVVGTFAVQALIVELGGVAFRTKGLSAQQWMWCFFIGFFELLWHQVVISIPKDSLPTFGHTPPPEPKRDARILWMRSLWRLQTQIRVVNAFRGQLERRPSIMVDGAVNRPVRSPISRAKVYQVATRASADRGKPDVKDLGQESNI